MFLTRFRNITLPFCTLLLCLSAQLHAVVIYETDFKASPAAGATITDNLGKGDFTTSIPSWATSFNYSSAYLTNSSSAYCIISFTTAIDLTKHKDVSIEIKWGSEKLRKLNAYINNGSQITLFEMKESDRSSVLEVSYKANQSSLSSIKLQGDGGGAAYFFHIKITGTPLVDCPEEPAKGDTTAYFFTGQSVTVWGETFYTETTRTKTYQTAQGCDSIVTLHIKETTSGSVTRDTICEKDTPYHWEADGKDYYKTTSTSIVKKNKQGTDSICMLYLTVNPTLRTSESHYMNEGESYTWHGQTYTEAGDYRFDTISKVTGCDSIVTLHLSTSSPTETRATICQGDTFYWYINGTLVDKYYSDKNPATKKIGGIEYKLYLTVQKFHGFKKHSSYNLNLTQGEKYTWRGKEYSTPGVYLDTVFYPETGCLDTIWYLVLNGDTATTICDGVKFYWDRKGQDISSSTSVSYKVKINGSDVTYQVSIKITKGNKSTSTTKTTIAPGGSCTWFGKQYTEQGTYTDTIPNKSGCDSIGTLILGVCDAIPDTITTKIVINEGSSYYWKYTDTKYNQSTKIDKDTINEFGCRTVMRLNLIVQRLSDADTAYSMCEGDVFEWRGLTITEAGKYTAKDGSNTTIHIGVLPQAGVNACEDKVITLGQSTQLSASGADYYEWWPTDSLNHKCLSSTWDTDPIATPLVSTMYYVKSYNSADKNSIINGDFELGPTAASSGKAGDPNLPAGAIASYYTHLWYTREDRKFGTHMISHWSGELFGSDKDKFPDHTKKDGTGWYMVIDGFNRDETPNDSILWQKEVEVTPGLDYIFSAWFVTLNNTSTLAELQFCVNGKPLGDVRYAPQKGNVWTRYYELWANDEKVTKATLTITNLNPKGDGNDFGLDDISFQALGPCFGEDSVRVTINFDIDLYPSCGHSIETRNAHEVPTMTDQTVTFSIPDYCTDQYGTYLEGDQLTVYAHDEECRVFSQWSDGNKDNPRIFTVGKDNFTVSAIYVGDPFTISTDQEGEGTVSETKEYMCKDTATVTAEAAPCWKFIKWKEDGETNPVRKFEVNENRTLTAIFERIPYYITIKSANGSQGKVGGQVN